MSNSTSALVGRYVDSHSVLVTYFCHLHFWLAESDAVSIDVTQQVRIKQAQTQGESLALIQVEM